ncbi:putative endonuclease [Alkalibacillus filiformis]|uniref:Endonuclease n=1 Tax=Alkalibacillus filiformis TaxID=200990 RepID=A0ABU0DPW5_9BACI|nr:GIY-YIG nuclease family protein [Alkalibacillus filiformis]MDQ0350379.1 putative endonuclease [Alkalibacillus filiformis]
MYYIYMLRCKDGSLYTGYTNDVESRVAKHQTGEAAKYTRAKLPVQLVYQEEFETRSEAMKREVAIKKLSKREKEELVK